MCIWKSLELIRNFWRSGFELKLIQPDVLKWKPSANFNPTFIWIKNQGLQKFEGCKLKFESDGIRKSQLNTGRLWLLPLDNRLASGHGTVRMPIVLFFSLPFISLNSTEMFYSPHHVYTLACLGSSWIIAVSAINTYIYIRAILFRGTFSTFRYFFRALFIFSW